MNYFDILLAKKLEDDRDPKVEGLSVTENGRYHEDGVVYDPVIVEVPEPTLISKNITANGDYSASADNADGYSSVSVNVPLPSNAYLLQTIENESIATFTDGTDNFLKALEVAIEPIQSGSGEPSPTNIRPISGWDEVKVTRCGKNLFDKTSAQSGKWINVNTGEIESQAGYTVTNFVKVKANTQYVFTNPQSSRRWFYDSNKNPVEAMGSNNPYTPSQNGYIALTIANNTVDIDSFQIEQGSTLSTFEPYNGHTYTIDLDGTRYGCKLDVVNGVLTVDRVNVFLKDLTFTRQARGSSVGGYYFRAEIDDNAISDTDATQLYSHGVSNNPYTSKENCARAFESSAYLFVGFSDDMNITTLADFNTWISNNQNASICYKIKTPIEIQLSPTIIKSLQGENYFFASTGEIEWMQYWGKEQN